MQFSFAYLYYLIHERAAFDIKAIYEDELDLDHDGVLNDREINHLGMVVAGRPVSKAEINELQELFWNVSLAMKSSPPYLNSTSWGHDNSNDSIPISMSNSLSDFESNSIANTTSFGPLDSDYVPMNLSELVVDLNLLIATPDLKEALEERFNKRKKYLHEVLPLDEVEFFMVPDNYTMVSERLADIRLRMPKFICLNDDMNKTHEPPPETLECLQDFYISYFPVPSPFEWTAETNPYGRNFSTIFEWRQLQSRFSKQNQPIHKLHFWTKIAACVACGLVIFWFTGYCHRMFSTMAPPPNVVVTDHDHRGGNHLSTTYHSSTIANPSSSSGGLINRLPNASKSSIV
jgi:hypothetical protein